MAKQENFKEAKLPKRLDKAIGGASWQTPDVLVGALRNRYQLDVCLECDFYHMPATHIDTKSVQYVAMYQSITLFGRKSGIHWYGKVAGFEKVRRYEIDEIPKASDEWYYRFDVKKWRKLSKPISAGGVAFVHLLTNQFLLRNSRTVAELLVGSEHQYRWLYALKKAMAQARRFFKNTAGFSFDGVTTVVSKGAILCIRDGKLVAQLEDVGRLEECYREIFDLYGQVYPEYSGLDRRIEYAE